MENSTTQNEVVEVSTAVVPTEPKGNGTTLKLMLAVKLFFCIVIIINNIIILPSLHRWKSLSKTSRLLIAHLSYADLLSGKVTKSLSHELHVTYHSVTFIVLVNSHQR